MRIEAHAPQAQEKKGKAAIYIYCTLQSEKKNVRARALHNAPRIQFEITTRIRTRMCVCASTRFLSGARAAINAKHTLEICLGLIRLRGRPPVVRPEIN